MRLFRFAIPLVLLGASMLVALPAAAFAQHASGFYDHQLINYEATAQVTSSPRRLSRSAWVTSSTTLSIPTGTYPQFSALDYWQRSRTCRPTATC